MLYRLQMVLFQEPKHKSFNPIDISCYCLIARLWSRRHFRSFIDARWPTLILLSKFLRMHKDIQCICSKIRIMFQLWKEILRRSINLMLSSERGEPEILLRVGGWINRAERNSGSSIVNNCLLNSNTYARRWPGGTQVLHCICGQLCISSKRYAISTS